MPHISESEFIKKFVMIIQSGRDLPKKPLDLNVLYISSILDLNPDEAYSETELNDVLRQWTDAYGENFSLDHVTLRRYLIDSGYIKRDPAGTAYILEISEPPYSYDVSVIKLDLRLLLQQAQEERDARKKRFINNQNKG